MIVCFPVDFISSFVSKSGPSLLETTLFNFGELYCAIVFFCEGGDGFDGFDTWFAFLLFQNEVRTCGANMGEASPDKLFGDDTGLRLVRLDFGDFTNRWLGSSNSSGRSGNSTMPPVLGIASAGNFFLDNIDFRRLMECLRMGLSTNRFFCMSKNGEMVWPPETSVTGRVMEHAN